MLHKLPNFAYIPGRRGQSFVPDREVCVPAYTPPPPPRPPSGGGSGSQTCSSGCIVIGRDEYGDPVYLCGVPVCRPSGG